MSAHPPDEHRGPTSEEGSWDILSSRSDEVASHSSDFNGVGTAFGDLDSHPSDMSLALSADSDEVTLAFQERDDILKAKLASVETQIDYMTSTANFPNLSSEEIMSRREAREQARADLVRLKEENQANRVRYDKLREDLINSTDGNLTPAQVLAKIKELDRVEVDLAESNAALRRMSEAQGDSSSGSDGDDEASSEEDLSDDSDESSVHGTTSESDSDEMESQFARSDGNSAADGGNNDASPANQGTASADQGCPTNDQNETVSISSDDQKYTINVSSVFNANSNVDSRRVLLEKIPQSTTLTQVANAVCGVGGLVRISVLENIIKSGTAFKLACVEFRDSTAAEKYVANVKANGLELVDANGRFVDIEVKLINNTSSYQSRHGHPHNYGVGHYSEHSGRCITLDNFPTSAIWYLFTRFGTKYIIRAWFSPNENQMNGKLSVELASTFEAGRLCGMILNRGFLPYHGPVAQMGFGPTPSDRDVEELTSSISNTIDYISPKHLADTWNVQPFNLFTPATNFVYGAPIPRRAVTSRTSSMTVEVSRIPSHYSGMSSVVPHILVRDEKTSTDLQDIPMTNITLTFVDEDMKYIVVGGQIFSREVTGDIYTKVDGVELVKLKQDNILKTKWAPFWKHYCEVNDLPDIRKYAEYGRIAGIRRNVNKKFGFASSWNPERLTAIPTQIINYLNPKSRKVVSTAGAPNRK
ncbi:hypothetical protein FOXYS1_269 [Fusarium oxysporum]|uniref:RRM domain-containing protein n=1 Tax=Fusarium oxysporum TaxID=5507 RepID=A0A8H5APR3_FUSOX|nr:hypothetical protein FOXYS1_269 [Fusarium oxysporum]